MWPSPSPSARRKFCASSSRRWSRRGPRCALHACAGRMRTHRWEALAVRMSRGTFALCWHSHGGARGCDHAALPCAGRDAIGGRAEQQVRWNAHRALVRCSAAVCACAPPICVRRPRPRRPIRIGGCRLLLVAGGSRRRCLMKLETMPSLSTLSAPCYRPAGFAHGRRRHGRRWRRSSINSSRCGCWWRCAHACTRHPPFRDFTPPSVMAVPLGRHPLSRPSPARCRLGLLFGGVPCRLRVACRSRTARA